MASKNVVSVAESGAELVASAKATAPLEMGEDEKAEADLARARQLESD